MTGGQIIGTMLLAGISGAVATLFPSRTELPVWLDCGLRTAGAFGMLVGSAGLLHLILRGTP